MQVSYFLLLKYISDLFQKINKVHVHLFLLLQLVQVLLSYFSWFCFFHPYLIFLYLPFLLNNCISKFIKFSCLCCAVIMFCICNSICLIFSKISPSSLLSLNILWRSFILSAR